MKLTEKQRSTVRLVTEALLSFALVLTGILFIYSCYGIYKSGPSPFTRESIADAFSKIAVAVYITVGIVVVSAVVDIAVSVEQKKLVGARSPKALVKRLSQKTDFEGADPQLVKGIENERRLRRILDRVRLAVNVACLVLPLIYLLNPANFSAVDPNSEILHGILLYLAFLSPAIILEVVSIILFDRSYTKEAELLRTLPKSTAKTEENIGSQSKFAKIKALLTHNGKEITLGLRIALVVCAVVFIAVGIFGGGMVDVLNKAIKICTECIGLG